MRKSTLHCRRHAEIECCEYAGAVEQKELVNEREFTWSGNTVGCEAELYSAFSPMAAASRRCALPNVSPTASACPVAHVSSAHTATPGSSDAWNCCADMSTKCIEPSFRQSREWDLHTSPSIQTSPVLECDRRCQ